MEVFHIIGDAFINLVGCAKIRITVGGKVGSPHHAKAAHAAVSASFDPDIDPEIIIA